MHSVFQLSQGSLTTLSRWGGWYSYVTYAVYF